MFNNNSKYIFYYILIAFIIFSILTGVFNYFLNDFHKSINNAALLVQALAILVGGFWAYRRFGWEKRAENLMELKGSLMKFALQHSLSAAKYRASSNEDIASYKSRLINSYNDIVHQVHASLYVPKKLRKKILKTVWLTVGNDHGPELEKLSANWKKFEEELNEIYKEFDKLVDI